MTADSLSTVFSPNLIRAADDDVGFFFANMSKAHKATKLLITHVRMSRAARDLRSHILRSGSYHIQRRRAGPRRRPRRGF